MKDPKLIRGAPSAVVPQPTFKDELEIALRLLEHIDTPIALSVYLQLTAGDYQGALEREVDPASYTDAQAFGKDYQAVEFLKKSALVPYYQENPKAKREERCLKQWLYAEEKCRQTNADTQWRSHPWLLTVQRHIADILGPLEAGHDGTHPVEKMVELGKHGPGASRGVRGRGGVPSDKYDTPVTLTAELLPFARAIMGENWWHNRSGTSILSGNKFSTVPKNAKTDRPIAIEPTLNQFIQLGIGRFISDRLKRYGFSISTQDNNRQKVLRAWRDGLATIDLTSASDLIAARVLMEVLPLRWYHLLDMVRSKTTEMPDGTIVCLEKFSSMGNGFTFPLQTTLFLALALSCVPEEQWLDVGVFGDDIIVPQAFAQTLVERLHALGLEVNLRKTHLAGAFYESCGVDTFQGVDVRPFYVRPRSTGAAPLEVSLANEVRRKAFMPLLRACDAFWQPFWVYLFDRAPGRWRRCLVPPGWGDVGFEHEDPGSKVAPRDHKPKSGAASGGRLVDYQGLWVETRAFRYMHPTARMLEKHTVGVMLSAVHCDVNPTVESLLLETDGELEWNPRNGSKAFSWKVPRPARLSATNLPHIAAQSLSYNREARAGLVDIAPRTGHAMWPTGWDWQ